jgi:hypothetical protein
VKLTDILSEYIDFSDRDKRAVDNFFEKIQIDGLTLSGMSGSRGGGYSFTAGNVQITYEDGITVHNPDTGVRTVYLTPTGDAWFGMDIDIVSRTSLIIFSNAQKYNNFDYGSGDLLIGNPNSDKANVWWDRSAGQLNFRGGTTVQAYIDTDGSVVAGAGAVKINSSGITIYDGDSDPNEIKFVDETEATTAFSIYMPSVIASPPGGSRTLNIESPGEADWDSHIKITASAGNDDTASLTLKAWANLQAAEVPYIYLYSNTGAADPDDQYIKFVGKKFLFEGWTGVTPIIVLEDDGSFYLQGTAGGAGQGFYYEDSGSTLRKMLNVEATNKVILANRASNGIVYIRANTSTAGAGGEKEVAVFEDDLITFKPNETATPILLDDKDIYTEELTDYYSSSTVTGFTATMTAEELIYKKIGKTMHVWFNILGDSNTTTFSFTLPFSNQATTRLDFQFRCRHADAWQTDPGLAVLNTNGSTVNLYRDNTGAAWANDGLEKGGRGYLCYETNEA